MREFSMNNSRFFCMPDTASASVLVLSPFALLSARASGMNGLVLRRGSINRRRDGRGGAHSNAFSAVRIHELLPRGWSGNANPGLSACGSKDRQWTVRNPCAVIASDALCCRFPMKSRNIVLPPPNQVPPAQCSAAPASVCG